MSTHNSAKIFLLKAYIAIHKFDIICISKTCLDSHTLSHDNNLEISGYSRHDLIILQTINEEVFVYIINYKSQYL